MSNLLQYTIQLRDQMSSVLNRLNGTTRSTNQTMNQLQRDTLNGSRALRDMGASANTLRQKLDQLKAQRGFINTNDLGTIRQYNREIQALERQINRVESTGGKGLVGGLMNAIKSAPFGDVLTNPLFQAGIIGGKALSLGIQQDMNKTSLKVMLGSEGAANQLMNDLSGIKMDQNVLSENAKMMLGFQVQAEKIVPVLSAIGDISMGNAPKMESLTRAFSQMSSTGKLNAEDLNQMIDAGFNPLSQMSKMTGKSVAQLKEEMAKGSISAQMVENAFIGATSEGGAFHNMLNQQAETLGGKWNTFMINMNKKLLDLYTIIGPIAEKGLELVSVFVDFADKGLGKMFKLIKEGNPWMWGLVTVLGAYTIGMGAAAAITAVKTGIDYVASGALRTLITNWWTLNAAMYANPVGLIIAGVVALIAVIGYVVYKTDGWGKMWQHTVKGATIIWTAFSTQAKSSFDILVNGFMIGVNTMQKSWYQFKNAIGLGDSGANDSMLKSLDQQIEGRKKAIDKAQTAFNNASYKGAGKAFADGFNSLSWNSERTLGGLIGETKSKFGIEDAKGGLGTTGLGGVIDSNLGNKKGKKSAEKTNSATTTGGQKSNYITINLDALIKGLQITTNSNEDSSNQIQQQTTDALLRVLAMATTAAG